MPLTYKGENREYHIWLHPGALIPEDGDKLKALCGGVHVYAEEDELERISEAGEDEDLDEWLTNTSVCSTCEDLLRERLGMETRDLTDVAGIGGTKMVTLTQAGFETVQDLRRATQEELSEVEGIGMALAARIKADVGNPPGRSL